MIKKQVDNFRFKNKDLNVALNGEVNKFIKENFTPNEIYYIPGISDVFPNTVIPVISREVEYFDGSVETVFTPTIILEDVEKNPTVNFDNELASFKKKGR